MDVQPGTVFINSFIKNDEDGQIPEATLKATTDAVISRIAAWPWCPSTYLHLEIAGEATYDDPENPGWSYSSVRVNAITE
uniref:Tail protein n=1 Tax=viral metagenome TaxID=1070528 RepID=A0A6M3L8R0_9ZZZZ